MRGPTSVDWSTPANTLPSRPVAAVVSNSPRPGTGVGAVGAGAAVVGGAGSGSIGGSSPVVTTTTIAAAAATVTTPAAAWAAVPWAAEAPPAAPPDAPPDPRRPGSGACERSGCGNRSLGPDLPRPHGGRGRRRRPWARVADEPDCKPPDADSWLA